MKIGRVAKKVGISVEAIRFYEKRGLIVAPGRNESGYRDYEATAVEHLAFIKRAKELGFSLQEIKDLIQLRRGPGATCGDVKAQAEAKIIDIERRIADLDKIKASLQGLVAVCPGHGPLSGCPIIGMGKAD